MPLGSTLVLNGRHVRDVTGTQIQGTAIFNLNNIQLSAVDRIEVSPTALSAIYGGDALARVVIIILRKDFFDAEGGMRWGAAAGTNRSDAKLAKGWQTDRLSVTAIASFSNQSPSNGGERALTSSGNIYSLGGGNPREKFTRMTAALI